MQGWKEQEDGASPWSRVLPEEGADMQEEDEEELERAERFEHQYNFRFEVWHDLWQAACCLLVCAEDDSQAGLHVTYDEACQLNTIPLPDAQLLVGSSFLRLSASEPQLDTCSDCQAPRSPT